MGRHAGESALVNPSKGAGIRPTDTRAGVEEEDENEDEEGFKKNWRQPTLAESIKPLPSARLCLTAEFGKGSGRTTALWPPKRVK